MNCNLSLEYLYIKKKCIGIITIKKCQKNYNLYNCSQLYSNFDLFTSYRSTCHLY